MRKLVLLSTEKECQQEISRIADAIIMETAAEVMQLLKEQQQNISVLLIEYPSEQKNIQQLIDMINKGHHYLSAIAVLILTDEIHIEEDSRFLGNSVVDCIRKPIYPPVLLNRIQNAETLMNSVSFGEFARMLKALPANIYLKDASGRYVFSSQTWHHLDTGDDPNWTIAGKTDLDIRKDKENAKLAMESDMRILRTGKGTSYIIEEAGDEPEYLQLIKEPLFFEDGRIRGIIALINNVTEQELMRRQLREKSTHDQLTGLYNRTYLDEYVQKLKTQNQYPVSILSADCDNLKTINDTYGHMTGDEYIRSCVEIIQKTLPENSCIFRTGGDEFVAFLPQTTPEMTENFIEKIRQEASSRSVKGVTLSISFGYASVADSDESIVECMKVSDNDMYQNKRRKKQKQT